MILRSCLFAAFIFFFACSNELDYSHLKPNYLLGSWETQTPKLESDESKVSTISFSNNNHLALGERKYNWSCHEQESCFISRGCSCLVGFQQCNRW